MRREKNKKKYLRRKDPISVYNEYYMYISNGLVSF